MYSLPAFFSIVLSICLTSNYFSNLYAMNREEAIEWWGVLRDNASKNEAENIAYQNKAFNKCKQVEITPENIIDLMDPMSDELKNALDSWFDKNFLLSLALSRTPLVGSNTEVFKQYRQTIKDLVEAAKSKLFLSFNFNFPIELEVGPQRHTFCVKHAGIGNQRENLNVLLRDLHYKDGISRPGDEYRPYGSPINEQEYVELQTRGLDATYQTISRAGNSILLSEWIHKTKPSFIAMPKTYLYHLKHQPEQVRDGNYVIIEEFIEGGDADSNKPLFCRAKQELINSAIECGQWNINPTQYICGPNNKLHLIDLESPNNRNPLNFHNKNRIEYIGNVETAVQEISKLCGKFNCEN